MDGFLDREELEERQTEQAELARLQRLEQLNDLRTVLNTVQGRRVLSRIMYICHKDEQSFVPGAADLTAFNEGSRRVGVEISNWIRNDFPDLYIQLLSENLKHVNS
ncbi:hypothetical protein [Methylomonas sp. AM2-LC]|uniref:Bbp19 family protein n=1 Tax=Methylomonas sp. AM2-LC TaxID=3153301 RepID=UPI00326395A9